MRLLCLTLLMVTAVHGRAFRRQSEDVWDRLEEDVIAMGNVNVDNIESVDGEWNDEVEAIENDLDHISSEGNEITERRSDDASTLAALSKKNVKNGGNSVPPADLTEYIPNDCSPEQFKKRSCDENFKAIVHCMKYGIEGLQTTAKSGIAAEQKKSIAGGVVGLAVESRAELRKLVASCKGKKESQRRFLSSLKAYMNTRK